jgi:1-phosphofructokinase family hexose kinase
MIYTVTLNPALDVSGTVKQLISNEKCYVHNETHAPGGSGINAGIIASRLKRKVILTGLLGGQNGLEIKTLLDDEKISNNFIHISQKTRMNINITNKSDQGQTRFSFPGPFIKASEKKRLVLFLQKIVSGDIVIIAGSLPLGINVAYVKKMLKLIRKKNARCFIDMPGIYLKDVIVAKPFFIKPNLSEFQLLIGKKIKTIKAILPYTKNILKYVPNICISSIEGGALLVSEHEIWFGKIPDVQIKSTVGAGDSMVGAMPSLWDLNPEASSGELLKWGLAASCATLVEPGLTLGDKKMMLKFRPQIYLQKL